MVLIIDKTYFDSIINSDIERKLLAVLPLAELPKSVTRQVAEGALTTMFMSEQDFFDVEAKVTEIINNKRGYYIKSYEELILNVTPKVMRRIYLPQIVGVLQICVVPELKSWL
jgi:hypothetical protein